jgi:hypothetical protein
MWLITLFSILFGLGNDHEIEFHEIESRFFFQEIERMIMRSKVVFSGDRKFL